MGGPLTGPVKVGIAGSTGSIGTQTLDVIRAENGRRPGSYEVVALGAGRSTAALIDQAREFRPALVIGLQDLSDTWISTGHLLMLAIVISIMAPLGDLTESMFKRNLDVKDFGAIIRGHGGVLDRFDGFLFTLPAVYYLMLVIEPWTAT